MTHPRISEEHITALQHALGLPSLYPGASSALTVLFELRRERARYDEIAAHFATICMPNAESSTLDIDELRRAAQTALGERCYGCRVEQWAALMMSLLDGGALGESVAVIGPSVLEMLLLELTQAHLDQPPRWWRCDDPSVFVARVVSEGTGSAQRYFLWADDVRVELRPDADRTMYAYCDTEGWMRIRCVTPPPVGCWRVVTV
jgi:hypothetical protein